MDDSWIIHASRTRDVVSLADREFTHKQPNNGRALTLADDADNARTRCLSLFPSVERSSRLGGNKATERDDIRC